MLHIVPPSENCNDLHVGESYPDPDSINSDRKLIEDTAKNINGLWSQINGASIYISAGKHFQNLHEHLSKHSRYDKTRIGWYRAFTPEENKFGIERRMAESYITVYEAFFHVGNVLPTWKLPQSFCALHALAKLKLSADQLVKCIDDGSIGPHSTVGDVRAVALTFKLAPPVSRTAAHPNGPKPAPIGLSPELWNCATLGEQQYFLASIGLPAVLAAMPADLKEQLEHRALASAKLRRTVVGPSRKPVTVEHQFTQALRIVLCTTAAIGERKGAFRSIERTLANEDTSFTANDLEVVILCQASNKAAKKTA